VKKLYLVRHGETTHNATGLVQDSETHLSDVGREQAKLIAKRLRHISYQYLLVSDYVRTIQTSKYITVPEDAVIEYTDLVREQRRPSEFFNKSNSSSDFWQFLEQEDLHISDPSWHWSDEENFYDVLYRVEKVYQLVHKYDRDVVIVTHGRFIIFFTAYMLFGQSLSPSIWKLCKYNFMTSNTGLTVFEFNDRFENWQLKTFNDVAHFAE